MQGTFPLLLQPSLIPFMSGGSRRSSTVIAGAAGWKTELWVFYLRGFAECSDQLLELERKGSS